jgi:hypothetical protein
MQAPRPLCSAQETNDISEHAGQFLNPIDLLIDFQVMEA